MRDKVIILCTKFNDLKEKKANLVEKTLFEYFRQLGY